MITEIRTKEQQAIIKSIDDYLLRWKDLVKEGYINRKKHSRQLVNKMSDITAYYTKYNLSEQDKRFVNKDSNLYTDYLMAINKGHIDKSLSILEKFRAGLSINIPQAELVTIIRSYIKDMKQLDDLSKDKVVQKIKLKNDKDTDKILETILIREIQIKKEKFIEQIETAGGKMLRLINLSMSPDSSLEGVVSCENDDIEIKTVSAGGHNIQVFHYRLYVKVIKRVNPKEQLDKDLLALSGKVVKTDEKGEKMRKVENPKKDKKVENVKKEVYVSSYRIPQSSLEPVIKRLVANHATQVTKKRSEKVKQRMDNSGYEVHLLENCFDRVTVHQDISKLYIVINKKKSEHYIITTQQAYVLNAQRQLTCLYDLTSQNATLDDVDVAIKFTGLKVLEIFKKINNFRYKL